ncbi:MAG: YkgJ family cysteine cluster protein [Planctomycetota bacterium]|nr:YkgJ family cysteine cluster protein [Planctomycetota bacterium]
MTTPIRNLPVMQNWDCHSCSDCCRIEAVITAEEKDRIEALDLANDPEVGARPWFAPVGGGSKNWKLRHRPDGACVFLTTANRCRIQERFGAAAKPFVCRLFPFVLIPAGNHWRAGISFSCPSSAANRGRPMAAAEADLENLSRLLERHVGRSAASAQPPLMQDGQRLPWPDVLRVVQVLVEIVQDRSDRVERRLRTCLAVARVCGRAKLDGLKGDRLSDFLQAVRKNVDADVPRDPADLPPPDRLLGKFLFRAFLAIYARRDRDVERAAGLRNRLGRVYAGWRFVKGRGRVPRVNDFLPVTSFEEVERRGGTPAEMDETLERYFVVKLSSMQFCGPPNFGLPFWAGLESLVLTMPMILWLSRTWNDLPPAERVQRAIQLVDDHFGGNPMLGFPHIQYLLRTMGQLGELEKLVAWYSR